MSRIISILIINLISTLCECHSPRREHDLRRHSEILDKLRNAEPETELRGLGHCMGVVYVFLNIPYMYAARAQDLQTNGTSIRLGTLYAANLLDYSDNGPLMGAVCEHDKFCERLADDVHMSVYTYRGNCLAYVVRLAGSPDFVHSFPLFDLHGRLARVHDLTFYGLKGIPFSNCGENYPIMRFAYSGSFVIENECLDEKYSELLSHFAGENSLGACLDERTRQRRAVRNATLVLTADNSMMERQVFESITKSHRRGSVRFGSCLGNKYVFFNDRNEAQIYELSSEQFNYFGFRYAPLTPVGTPFHSVGQLFNGTVARAPNESPLHTDARPVNAEHPWGGMPTKVGRAQGSGAPTPDTKKFYKKYIAFFIVGIILLILLFAVFIFCLLNIKCFPSRHRPEPKPETILVQVTAPEPKKKHEPHIPKLMPLTPATTRALPTPVTPAAPPMDNPSPESLVSRKTDSDPVRTYQNPTSNTFSTMFKKAR